MQDQLKFINARAPLVRLVLVAAVALALVCSWYAVRWYAGNVVAESAAGVDEGGLDLASTAVGLAPNDPFTQWTLGGLETKSLPFDQLPEAIRHYEAAVRLSPNDYRLWMDLGHARAQAGEMKAGEEALRRAVELAPSYSFPRWYLGNLLVRDGRIDEGFAELRRAGDGDATLRPQIFNLAWRVYGEDVDAVREALGDSVEARVQLAASLIGLGRVDDAVRLWSSLSAAEKKEQSEAGKALLKSLFDAKRFRAALEIERNLAPENLANEIAVGKFRNSGFESDVGEAGASVFDWNVETSPQAQAAIDKGNRHAGERSLRVFFNASAELPFNNIRQLVVVDSGASYRFNCYARTEDLKSAVTPVIEILDAASGAVLATTAPLPVGKNDWLMVSADFKTGAKTEAVLVRTARAACESAAACPIFGTIWYDDFNLQRTGGSVNGGGAATANVSR
jgi:tetratricopeptide (TPR) repeat protein